MPIGSFNLVADNKNNIYLTKITNIIKKNLDKSSSDFNKYNQKATNQIKIKTYSSFDSFLNQKYKVKVNEKTLERVKNYFR
jgi:peptidyl-prolyl cis-trans isomerase D